jgi:hypothetical protein
VLAPDSGRLHRRPPTILKTFETLFTLGPERRRRISPAQRHISLATDTGDDGWHPSAGQSCPRVPRATTDPHCTATVCPENHTATPSVGAQPATNCLSKAGVRTRSSHKKPRIASRLCRLMPQRGKQKPRHVAGVSRVWRSVFFYFLLLGAATPLPPAISHPGAASFSPATPDVSFIGIGLLNQCALESMRAASRRAVRLAGCGNHAQPECHSIENPMGRLYAQAAVLAASSLLAAAPDEPPRLAGRFGVIDVAV